MVTVDGSKGVGGDEVIMADGLVTEATLVDHARDSTWSG